jgi:hypothetical protein
MGAGPLGLVTGASVAWFWAGLVGLFGPAEAGLVGLTRTGRWAQSQLILTRGPTLLTLFRLRRAGLDLG